MRLIGDEGEDPQMKAREKEARRSTSGWAYFKALVSVSLLFMKIPLYFIVRLFLRQGLQDPLLVAPANITRFSISFALVLF